MFSVRVRNVFLCAIIIQVLAFLSILLIPAVPILRNEVFIVLLNFLFIMLVFCCAVIAYSAFPKVRSHRPVIGRVQLNFNVLLSSFGGLLGLIFIFYDRVFVRGIDYSAGLRAARYEWLATSGGGFFGVVGNLLVPLSYFSLFLLIVYKLRLMKFQKLLLILSAIVGIMGHAALNGGRSNVLIAMFIVCIITLFTSKSNIRFRFGYLIGLAVCLIFGLYMTNQSAVMAGVSVSELSARGIESLYGVPKAEFHQSESPISYFVYYILAYLFHGNWTAEISYSLDERPGSYTLYSFSVIFKMLGIDIFDLGPGAFSSSGAFISFPGAVYYDFGFLGCVIVFSLLGFLWGCALYAINYKALSLTGIAFCLYVTLIIFMSPILPAYGLTYVNFVIYIFILTDVVNRFIFGGRRNWLDDGVVR